MGEIVNVSPKELVYWWFGQFYRDRFDPGKASADLDWYINFRCVHNQRPTRDPQTGRNREVTDCMLNEFIRLNEFRTEFLKPGGIFDKLVALNQNPDQPCNVYHAVNPRTRKRGNKKADVAGFLAYYLDLDVTDKYTLKMRQQQIEFWIACRMEPTLVAFTGHGYHVYWILKTLVPAEQGEKRLKKIIALSGCKQGGAVQDVTRILRTPGFMNVKKWYVYDKPQCNIVYPPPEYVNESIAKNTLLRRYDESEFDHFPASEIDDIERYTHEAMSMPGDLNDNLYNIAKATYQHRQSANAHQSAANIVQHENVKKSQIENPSTWEPTLKHLPPDLNDIPFPRGHKRWMRIYCRKGHDQMTIGELDMTRQQLGTDDVSPSVLDYRVIYALCRLGYTMEAVREFWLRPDMKLYRADKEAKSEGYFERTYEKALQAVRDSFTQLQDPMERAKKAAKNNYVLVHNYQTFIQHGDASRFLLNGEVVPVCIHLDKDATKETDREYYEVNIRVQDMQAQKGFIEYAMILPRHVFNSCKEFRTRCHGRFTLLTDKNSDLQHLITFLEYQYPDIPRKTFHSRLSYDENKFVFPYITVHKDKFEYSKTFKLIKELENKMPWHKAFAETVCSREELAALIKDVMPQILKVHLPRVVCSIIGTIVASGMRAILDGQKGSRSIHIPTVNIRGASTKGKSETAKLLYKICGMVNDEAVVSVDSTKFSLSRLIQLSSFIPCMIDEFKLEKETEKQIAQIRELVRRSYSGEMLLRGRADLGVTGICVHSALIIIGETHLERIGNVSEISRIIPISIDNWNIEDSQETYDYLATKPLHCIGPYMYQALLNEDPQEAAKELRVITASTNKIAATYYGAERARIGHNLAVLIWGCRLFDRFIKSVCPGIKGIEETYDMDNVLTRYMGEWAIETGQSMVIKTNEDGAVKRTVVARDEFFDFFGTLSEMIQRRDAAVQELNDRNVPWMKLNEKKLTLALRIPIAYDAYLLHMQKRGRHPIGFSKLKSLIASADATKRPWMKARQHSTRIGKYIVKCDVFDVGVLRQMGVWHDPSDADYGRAAAEDEIQRPNRQISEEFDLGEF